MVPFADLLTRYRLRAGLGMHELARAAAYDPSYISRLEGDERAPSRTVVDDLAAVLECSPAEHDELLVTAGYAPDWLLAVSNLEALRLLAAHPHGVADTLEALGLAVPGVCRVA